MSGDVLLDTNIVIALFARDAAVLAGLRQTPTVFVPSIVLGELYYGANNSKRASANVASIDQFSAASTILTADAATARHYGDIKNLLKIKGRPIPENDIWIAAIAAQHALTLVTRDAHFREVDGLAVNTW
jgi:tRNA(fMet)-specific endonuclease VapC